MQKIEILDILTYVAKDFDDVLMSAKRKLKVEKSGDNFDFLQGEVAGLEGFRLISEAEGFKFYDFPIEKAKKFVDISPEGERRLSHDYLHFESARIIKRLVEQFESGSYYKILKKRVDREILDAKKRLFSDESNLFEVGWTHGFITGITKFFSALTLLCELAKREEDYASENAPLFWGA